MNLISNIGEEVRKRSSPSLWAGVGWSGLGAECQNIHLSREPCVRTGVTHVSYWKVSSGQWVDKKLACCCRGQGSVGAPAPSAGPAPPRKGALPPGPSGTPAICCLGQASPAGPLYLHSSLTCTGWSHPLVVPPQYPGFSSVPSNTKWIPCPPTLGSLPRLGVSFPHFLPSQPRPSSITQECA